MLYADDLIVAVVICKAPGKVSGMAKGFRK